MKKSNGKKYVIKDTITDSETGAVLIFFTGADGYVYTEEDFFWCDGFKRRGNAIRHIKNTASSYHYRPLSEDCMTYIEGDKWIHRCEVLTIE